MNDSSRINEMKMKYNFYKIDRIFSLQKKKKNGFTIFFSRLARIDINQNFRLKKIKLTYIQYKIVSKEDIPIFILKTNAKFKIIYYKIIGKTGFAYVSGGKTGFAITR